MAFRAHPVMTPVLGPCPEAAPSAALPRREMVTILLNLTATFSTTPPSPGTFPILPRSSYPLPLSSCCSPCTCAVKFLTLLLYSGSRSPPECELLGSICVSTSTTAGSRQPGSYGQHRFLNYCIKEKINVKV